MWTYENGDVDNGVIFVLTWVPYFIVLPIKHIPPPFPTLKHLDIDIYSIKRIHFFRPYLHMTAQKQKYFIYNYFPLINIPQGKHYQIAVEMLDVGVIRLARHHDHLAVTSMLPLRVPALIKSVLSIYATHQAFHQHTTTNQSAHNARIITHQEPTFLHRHVAVPSVRRHQREYRRHRAILHPARIRHRPTARLHQWERIGLLPRRIVHRHRLTAPRHRHTDRHHHTTATQHQNVLAADKV